MEKDPYRILEVDRNATDEEIKKAYLDKVRKYHPDRYRDSELAEVANKKMAEINAAYDEIQKMRESGGGYSSSGGQNYGGYSDGYGGGYTGGGSYGDTGSGYSGGTDGERAERDEIYARVRAFLTSNRLYEARALLLSISESGRRDAEWFFLYGCVQVRFGNYVDAGRCFDAACRMDPYNSEYSTARDELRTRGAPAGRQEDDTCNSGMGGDCFSGCMRLCCFLSWCNPCGCCVC